MKQATSFRLSTEALELLRELAHVFGVSQADALEIALRALAREHLDPTITEALIR